MEIKICSANIRYENNEDGIHSWSNRKALLAHFFNSQNLDILGTQEGRENQIRSIENEINLKIAAHHRNWIEERMYPTLFYNEHKLNLIDSGDFWLSETPLIAGSSSFNSAFPRLATWIKVQNKKNLKCYLVINVHLDHVLPETRIEQAKVMSLMIKKINSENYHSILFGDFNDSPNGQVYQILCEELKLIDLWKENNLNEETSYHAFNGPTHPGSRIDWMLGSNELKCNHIYLDKTCIDGIYLSDHFPLVATLIPN
jgi:endonuclease/exonuclease/phosphatase family metal-dependent hydrolase